MTIVAATFRTAFKTLALHMGSGSAALPGPGPGYYTLASWCKLGREIARRLPNGVTTYQDYDTASQVTSVIHLGTSGVLQSLYDDDS